jgi:hypothetical protein
MSVWSTTCSQSTNRLSSALRRRISTRWMVLEITGSLFGSTCNYYVQNNISVPLCCQPRRSCQFLFSRLHRFAAPPRITNTSCLVVVCIVVVVVNSARDLRWQRDRRCPPAAVAPRRLSSRQFRFNIILRWFIRIGLDFMRSHHADLFWRICVSCRFFRGTICCFPTVIICVQHVL